ncbi:uncharacterized protein TNCV_3224151 [Trichonephila clavipes]|nr:uncharacterized protein TNCV_3224151 [Trichonephila clavipes]
MRQIGKGFAGAFKLCSTLNLPRLTKTAYKNQDAKLLKVVQEVAEESMIKAATEIVEKKQNLSSDIVILAVHVDNGKWVDVPITPDTKCQDVIECCREPSDEICSLIQTTGLIGKKMILPRDELFDV